MPNNTVVSSQDNPIYTQIVDGQSNLSILGGAAETIDKTHAEIHEGDYYTLTKLFKEVVYEGYADLHIRTGANKKMHTIIVVQSEAKSYVSIYRGATYTNNGTVQTILNNDENSTNTTECTAYYSPTITAIGTLIYQDFVPAGTGPHPIGADLVSRNERILKPNTDYLVRAQNVAGQSVPSDISITINYYEE